MQNLAARLEYAFARLQNLAARREVLLQVCKNIPLMSGMLYGANQSKAAKKGAAITVQIPQTTMERLLMEPSTGPSSMALAVPMACEAEPRAIPRAMGSVICNHFNHFSAIMLPKTPVMMMTATEMET